MNTLQLKNLIKEEIKTLIKEEDQKMEVKRLTSYLQGPGKSSLGQINTVEELKAVLDLIWGGMGVALQKNPRAAVVKKLIDQRLA